MRTTFFLSFNQGRGACTKMSGRYGSVSPRIVTVLQVLLCVFILPGYGQWDWDWVEPYQYRCMERAVQAICRFRPNPNVPTTNIHGILVFTQRVTCYNSYSLQVKINIGGMYADGNWTYHGLHVHVSGDMRNGCESMGPHFNPFNTQHGSHRDPVSLRHVGDLGNVVKDPFGNIQGALFDNVASLAGPYSIIGRGIQLHEKQDDFGRLGNDDSLQTGNSGRALACCYIERL